MPTHLGAWAHPSLLAAIIIIMDSGMKYNRIVTVVSRPLQFLAFSQTKKAFRTISCHPLGWFPNLNMKNLGDYAKFGA